MRSGAGFRAYARILWRRKLLLLALIVILPLGAYFYERSRPKVYESSSMLAMVGNPQAGLTSLIGGQSNAAPNITQVLVDAQLITSNGVARLAAKYLRPKPTDLKALLSDVSASADTTTGFITISARSGNALKSAEVANAFAQAMVSAQASSVSASINRAVRQIQAQVRALPSNDPTRFSLSDQIAGLRALSAARNSGAQIVKAANVPTSPASPRVERSVILALIAAILLGLGLVAVAEITDRRIRDPDEVGDFAGLPLLSAIPAAAFSRRRGGSPRVTEAFATLRSSLTFFNVDDPLSTVLVTSPGKADGKTTVAVRLAESFARAGTDVILMDTDLRRPRVAGQLGLPSSPGLAAVLLGRAHLDQALLQRADSSGRTGGLNVLPAGSPPPNPSELLASRRMQTLMTELSGRCELLIIDSAPIFTVSDSLPLVPSVSGVVFVARVGRTSREALARLRFVVDSAGGRALGVVATGAKTGGLYAAHGYGYKAAYVSAAAQSGAPSRSEGDEVWDATEGVRTP